MTVYELKYEVQERGVEFSFAIGKKKERLRDLLREVRSRPLHQLQLLLRLLLHQLYLNNKNTKIIINFNQFNIFFFFIIIFAIIDFEKEEVVLT